MDRLVKKINGLIVRISKGDTDALDELYSLTGRMLLSMAKKYLYDKNFSEDLVSETYYKLVKNSKSFDGSKNGLNWLFKIIKNGAINFNLRNNPAGIVSFDDALNANVKDDIDDWLDEILIENALHQLSEDEKRIIYMRYWEGLGINEIAALLNKPLSTAYDYIKRVLKKLKKLLK